MHNAFFCPGGVTTDFTDSFCFMLYSFCVSFMSRLTELSYLLNNNAI